MTGTARLGYAINQWKPNFDDFTRREQHVRALKVIAASGFTGIELRAGSGRWDPLGRPASIAANYGSAAAFTDLLRQIGVEAVCSWYFDPAEPVGEELSPGRSVLEGGQHRAIAESVKPFAEFLAAAGGDRGVERWFYECGTPGGLVDFPALLAALRADGYSGWLVFESDQTPNPARSVMLNGWYARHMLPGLSKDLLLS